MNRALGAVGCAAGAVLFVGVSLALTDGVTERPDDWLASMFIEGQGGRVFDDAALVAAASGELVVSNDLVLAAFCANSSDWIRDRSLGLNVVVATDPALIRAAELHADAVEAGRRRDAALIADVESAYWRHGANTVALDEWASRLTDDDVADAAGRYLAERRQPPSAEASDRFVVYVSNPTTFVQQVNYVDTFRLSPELLRAASSRGLPDDVVVAGEDVPRHLVLSLCGALAGRWDRFDAELPTLPPIRERWRPVIDEI